MQKIFKNANLVDIENGSVELVDLYVENGIIKDIQNADSDRQERADIIDLNGDFVLPPFVNAFCHSFNAFEKNYGCLDGIDAEMSKYVQYLMIVKNVLAGATFNDLSEKNGFACVLLDCIDERSEQELSELVSLVAQDKSRLFIDAGRTLEELGTIDMQYKKPLSQVLEDFGFLDRAPTIVGGNCFEKDDLELFSQYDCSFCLTPSADGKSGIRPTNLVSLKSKDFCVGIGSGSSFEIDFFAFMRQIIMTQRGLFEDESCIDEKDVFQMATTGGTKMLGIENYGVKKGSLANFIVVSGGRSLYQNPLKTLVWEKSKRDVLMTVFKGEILQKNGEIFMKNLPKYDTIISEIQQRLRRN